MSGVHACDNDVQSLPDRHRSEWWSFQVFQISIEYERSTDVIKRSDVSDRIAINEEFLTVRMRLQSNDFCDF